MHPPAGRPRLQAFVRGRDQWCISRQRAWGVPLPAFYDAATGEALLTEETVAHVRPPPSGHARRRLACAVCPHGAHLR